MSTYQPPGGKPPEGAPGYSQPQDPWEGGFEPGMASVPTDPIPQRYEGYGPYGPGHQGEIWSQQTMAQGGPYGYVPQQPPKSRAGLIVLVILIVLLLGGGAGVGAWYFTTKRNPIGGASQSSSPNRSTSSTATITPFDPHAVKVGDCLVNLGSNDVPDVHVAPCATKGSFKVIKVASGSGIPKGPGGKFDRDTTSVQVCADTGYQSWYGYQSPSDHSKDVFFCMTNNAA
jgi:hypothetical protein